MTALLFISKWWKSHGTGILGFATSFCAGLVLIPDLIPVNDKPYWAAANLGLGLLTIQRSNTNRKNLSGEPTG